MHDRVCDSLCMRLCLLTIKENYPPPPTPLWSPSAPPLSSSSPEAATAPQTDTAHSLCAVQRRRGPNADPISEDDILRAIGKLKALGSGFQVIKVSHPANKLHDSDRIPAHA